MTDPLAALVALLLVGGKGGGLVTPEPLAPPPFKPSAPIAPGWPIALPPTLPPFPGPGWEPDQPVPTPVVQRAVALVPQLWAQGEGSHLVEMTGGHWVAYLAQMLNGKHGVTAWRLKQGTTVPAAGTIPATRENAPPIVRQASRAPGVAVVPAAPRVITTPQGPALVVPAKASVLAPPPPVPPYPGAGAYASNASYIRSYQTVLAYLAAKTGNHDWDPGAVDGRYGPSTHAGVLAFQKFQGHMTEDGEAGPQTAAALNRWLASASQAA